jgi:ribosomal protein L14
MIRKGSVVYCVDNTGVKLVKVFQVIGSRHRRKANLGDFVLIIIRARNLKAKNMKSEKQLWRFRRGSVHRAIVVNVNSWHYRSIGIYIRWTQNAVILVDRKKTPLGSRINATLTKEFLTTFPAIGSICDNIV